MNLEMEFAKRFGTAPTAQAQANGRVNLIGEHTDYNGGFVLPTSIPQSTRSWIAPRTDSRVRFTSANKPGPSQEYVLGQEKSMGHWGDYIQGVTKILAADGFLTRGFDLLVSSDVPMGSGLSSSAALEVSVLKALRAVFQIKDLSEVQMARIGQRVENEFVGARVGIMDQMAAALASEGTALFLDTRSMTFEQVHLPTDRLEIAVINSGITHSHAGGEYNQRRAECEKACELLGVQQLRDVTIEDLPKLAKLPDVNARRAKHIITENARVLEFVSCVKSGKIERLGELLREAHRSMQYDFEISIPQIDALVEIANSDADVIGARMTGGGFGGSIVILAQPGKSASAAARIAARYRETIGGTPTVLVPLTH